MATLFRNGTVVDGTGKDAYRADVLVEGDRIAAVFRGGAPAIPEAETIDADGSLVTPGFVDAHAHSDAYLILEPDAPSKVSQGITTEINGQCGGSIAPRFGEARLSSDWATLLGERLTWRTLGEYRAVLDAVRPALNTVQFVGHNTLRSSVVGYAARPSTPDEMAAMRRLLEQAMDEGAYGLTTGLIYQPGRYATNDEVESLVGIVAKRGGFYATHIRSEGDALLESIGEVIALAERTGVRAEISHLKTSGRRNWPKIDAALERIGSAVERGTLLGSDRYPYCAAGTDLDVVLPDWAQEGASLAEMARLTDPAARAKIVCEINASDRDWSTVMIGGTWHPDTARFSGMNVRTVVETAFSSPGEAVCSILERDGCKTGAFFFGMSEDNLDKIYRMPWIVPGSDASLRAPWGPLGKDFPHPRAYATMPEFYRRLRSLGFTREETVRRMTSIPASRFQLRDRGVIAEGAHADLVVWREEDFRAAADYSSPHRFSTGVSCVMVNGVIPYRDGRFTGNRAGRML